jgi:chromate transporter
MNQKESLMEKNARFYWKLFISTFYLSAFTIGGGYVIVPLMRKKFVDEYKWIEEKEMIDIVAVSQSSPGPIAVNASILVGYRLAGLRGSLMTILGTILPPLIIISIISVFYTAFQESRIINAALMGMRAAVAAVMIDAIYKLGKTVLKGDKLFSLIIMIAAFILAFFININVALILLMCGFVGWVTKFIMDQKQKGKDS